MNKRENNQEDLKLQMVSCSDIRPNDWNPNEMEQTKFMALVDGIKEKGFKQPILVREDETGQAKYEIIDGEHRWRAAQEAGLVSIPVMIVTSDTTDSKLDTVAMNNLRGEMMSVGLARIIVDIVEEKGEGYVSKFTGLTGEEIAGLEKLLIPPDLDEDFLSDVNVKSDVEVPVEVSILLMKDKKKTFDKCMDRAIEIMAKKDTIPQIDSEDSEQVKTYDKAMKAAMLKLNTKRRSEALSYICDVFLAQKQDEE